MNKKNSSYDQLKTQNYYATVLRSGFQETGPLQEYSCIKNNYVFEYFIEGEGVINVNNKPHKVQKGDLILWPINKFIQSQSSHNAPFKYWWVDFFGPSMSYILEQIGFNEKRLVMHFDDDTIPQAIKDIHTNMQLNNLSGRFSALSCFFDLISYLISLKKQTRFERNFVDIYIEKAIWYIQTHFRDDLKTADIANHINISESYLSSIFRQKMGVSLIDYLISHRIEQAQNMLAVPNLPITLISQNCGFNSPSYFTMKFKQITGMTPKEYRQLNIQK